VSIVVTREADSRLERNVWRFWVTVDPSGSSIKVLLDSYSEEARATLRHNYRATSTYQRIDKRNCTIQNVAEVPRPADVHAEALQQVLANIRIVISDGRNVEAPFCSTPEDNSRAPLRWEAVPFGRGDVEAFVDVPGLGRYLVSRAGKSSREFFVRLNNGPVKHRGPSEDCKRWVQQLWTSTGWRNRGFLTCTDKARLTIV
jgi:hypothetical protein